MSNISGGPALPRALRAAATLLVAGAALWLTACASAPTHARRTAPGSLFHPEAGFTAAQIAMIEDNCGPFGMPKLDPQWPHGPTDMVIREGYVLEHSAEDKIARWVCEHVTLNEVSGDLPRHEPFGPDPQLQGKPRSELADYKHSGFDRGHAAPAGNQTVSRQLKDETFFLSNMSPQRGPHNQKIWAELEHTTRDWVRTGVVGSEFIITGGFFYDPAEEDSGTADGLIDYLLIGSGAVAVPTHYFKIVLAETSPDHWRAVAFVQENREYPTPYDFHQHIKPIDWIEQRTGIDFLPDLDPALEQQIEAQSGTLFTE